MSSPTGITKETISSRKTYLKRDWSILLHNYTIDYICMSLILCDYTQCFRQVMPTLYRDVNRKRKPASASATESRTNLT